MIDLQKYVDGLFRHQRLTPEVKDLKEEILSNMIAKRDDCKNRYPSPICTQFEHHFHALKPHLLCHSF